MAVSRTAVTIRKNLSLGADAIRDRGYLYTSGVCPLDEHGRVVAPGNLRAQAHYIYRAPDEILAASASGWSDVVKVNYYVAPQVDTPAEREVLREAHAQAVPPGVCAVLGAPLPQPVDGCLLQIELIARPGASLRPIATVAGVPAMPQWAAAVQADETLYVSGQLPFTDPMAYVTEALRRPDGQLGAQTSVVYGHYDRILKHAGFAWDDAVQVHQFISEPRIALDDFQRARHQYLTPGRYLSTSVACLGNFPQGAFEHCLILADMEADTRARTAVIASDTWGNPGSAQGYWTGPLFRMHGQVPRDLALKTQHAGDALRQAELTFSNLGGVLRAAGAGWSDVVHARIFCKSRDDVETVRNVRMRYLAPGSCAITELVADFFDPLLLVEIELVVLRSS